MLTVNSDVSDQAANSRSLISASSVRLSFYRTCISSVKMQRRSDDKLGMFRLILDHLFQSTSV